MDRRRMLALIDATPLVGCQEPLVGSTPEPPQGSVSLVKTEGPVPPGFEGDVGIRRARFDSDRPALIELRLWNTSGEPRSFEEFNDYPIGLVYSRSDEMDVILVGPGLTDGP